MSKVVDAGGYMPKATVKDKEPYLVALGARIRELRRAKGLSQDDFAAQAGMHRTHPTKFENGLIDPRLSTLRRIAQVLSLPVADLLREEDQSQS